MKTESIMWRKIRPVFLAARLDPVRVENPILPGTPDVNLASGDWLELKTIEAWPQRIDTPVSIRHFTDQQRVWLYRRWKYAPGTTHLLLEVRDAKQWLLFDGDVAAKIVGRGTVSEHRLNARAVLGLRELVELPKILVEAKAPPRTESPITEPKT